MVFDENHSSSITAPHDAIMARRQSSEHGNGLVSSLSRLEALSMKLPSSYVVPVSGGLAGAASGIVSCPLDVIKTKLQAQGGFKISKESGPISSAAYRGVKGTAATIWQEEGLRGMYRGLGPMLLGYVPTWAVYLTVYNRAQSFFNTKTENKFLANIYASVTAGGCSTMVTNPIWVIKTRLMSQSGSAIPSNHFRAPWHYRNTADAFRKMYRTEGLLSFYSGLTPALFGLTHVAIQFPLYEIFKERFTGIRAGEKESDEDKLSHFWGLSLAVFMSKVIASTATYPHEVVRTRLQTQQRSGSIQSSESSNHRGAISNSSDHGRPPGGGPFGGFRARGTIQTIKIILAEEGWRGFYAGLGTNLIRAVPSAMTTILTFEYLKSAFFRLQLEGKEKLDSSSML